MFTYLSHLECARCDKTHDADVLQGLCECGSPLLARYDLERMAAETQPREWGSGDTTMWRYHSLLPVRAASAVVSLGEGMTPLLPVPRLGAELRVPRLLMKDEGVIPTGTFKARGAAAGVSAARERGANGIAMATQGNAGAAWSTYAARAGLPAFIAMPDNAPAVTRVECAITNAELKVAPGSITDAARLVPDIVAARGWLDVSTLKEPYRLEGKKTMGFELAEQLGWRAPDVIVYPTGGGVGLLGLHKAFRELSDLGWLEGPLPRLVAAQSSVCAPVVSAFRSGSREVVAAQAGETVAFGIAIAKPLGDFLVLDALYATGGCAVAVEDFEILREQALCARLEGAFVCPEGAAAFAAVRHLKESGWLSADDEVVVLNTGSGLKYSHTVQAHAGANGQAEIELGDRPSGSRR